MARALEAVVAERLAEKAALRAAFVRDMPAYALEAYHTLRAKARRKYASAQDKARYRAFLANRGGR